jgi:hypothetical protein
LAFYSGREADHSPPSSAEVEEWVELYLHSPNTPSWRGAQLEGAQGLPIKCAMNSLLLQLTNSSLNTLYTLFSDVCNVGSSLKESLSALYIYKITGKNYLQRLGK